MTTSSKLPATHRALVLTSTSSPLTVEIRPTPQPTSGSAIIRIVATNILPYAGEVYTGLRPYPFPKPFVPGSSAVGHVAALGPDAVNLCIGDLVYVDSFLHGRDAHSTTCLQGLHSGMGPGSSNLVESEWRDGTYAEYARVPLENCTKLPNPKETTTAALSVELISFTHIGKLLVPFGGLRDLKVQPGEIVIVAPATGTFGGCCVEVALAMGCRVIAAGRNEAALGLLKEQCGNQRLRTVTLTGDVEIDAKAFDTAHAFIDWCPPSVTNPTHIKSAIMALKADGRICLMGGLQGDVSIPYSQVWAKNLKLSGRFMYDVEAPQALVNMIEAGIINIDLKTVGPFKLEDWREAFDAATIGSGVRVQTVFTP